jgi:hypothetical protein
MLMPRVMARVMHIPGVAETTMNVGIKTLRTEESITLFTVS